MLGMEVSLRWALWLPYRWMPFAATRGRGLQAEAMLSRTQSAFVGIRAVAVESILSPASECTECNPLGCSTPEYP